MTRYEYRVAQHPEHGDEGLSLQEHQTWLDAQAEQGWELVSVVRMHGAWQKFSGPVNRFYFKRAYHIGELG